MKNNMLRIILLLFCAFAFGCSTKTSDCKVNDPNISLKYYGECRNGLANGYGEAQGRDRYSGSFKEGLQHGDGYYVWGESSQWAGNRFDGKWIKGESVVGKKIEKNNRIYIGEFSSFDAHGYGVMYSNNGNKNIEAMLKNNEFNGDQIKRGFWFKGDYVFSCGDHDDCINQLKAGQSVILEKFHESKEYRQSLNIAKDIFLISNCFINTPNRSAKECFFEANGPLGVVAASLKNKNKSFNDLSEIRAGLYPEKSKVVVAGLGLMIGGVLTLATSPLDFFSPSTVDVNLLDPDSKYSLIQACSDLINRCQLGIYANVVSTSPIIELSAISVATGAEINQFQNGFQFMKSSIEKVEYKSDVLKFISSQIDLVAKSS